MAKTFAEFEIYPGWLAPNTYGMFGPWRLNRFDETCEVDFYIFVSEAGRNQELAKGEHPLHRPIKVITMRATHEEYEKYIAEPARALAAATYRWATEVPAGVAVEPRGLKELLEGAEDH